MKILVTGGAGYIGSHVAQLLLSQGEDVFVFDNLSSGYREAVPQSAFWVEGDVRDTLFLTDVLKSEGIEAVIHLAGRVSVANSFNNPFDCYDQNVGGTVSVVKACLNASIDKIVYSSSAAVYGNPKSQPISECFPFNPMSPYGSSKAQSEKILIDCEKQYGLKSARLRYFNVAGSDISLQNGERNPASTHLIKRAARAACGLSPSLSVFGSDYPTRDGTCERDYIHVLDLAELHVRSLRKLGTTPGGFVLNCGYGRGYSVLEVVESMRRVSDVHFQVNFLPRRQGDPATLIANSSLAKSFLGWVPQYDNLDLICRSAFEWESYLKSQLTCLHLETF